MKQAAIYSFVICLIASSCASLEKSPESTRSAQAAYGVYPVATARAPKEKKKKAPKQVKIKQPKERTLSRTVRSPWTGG